MTKKKQHFKIKSNMILKMNTTIMYYHHTWVPEKRYRTWIQLTFRTAFELTYRNLEFAEDHLHLDLWSSPSYHSDPYDDLCDDDHGPCPSLCPCLCLFPCPCHGPYHALSPYPFPCFLTSSYLFHIHENYAGRDTQVRKKISKWRKLEDMNTKLRMEKEFIFFWR